MQNSSVEDATMAEHLKTFEQVFPKISVEQNKRTSVNSSTKKYRGQCYENASASRD